MRFENILILIICYDVVFGSMQANSFLKAIRTIDIV